MPTTCHKQSRLVMLIVAGALTVGGGIGNAAGRDQGSVGSKQALNQTSRSSSALADNFETTRVNRAVWWMGQAHRGQYWVEPNMARTAQKSIAIGINARMRGCGKTCQRNEIRTAPRHQIKFGAEAWYGFSFRLTGAMSKARWVSGQWKQQSGGSPFLAQRFDSGVFSITVQDNNCRVIVAKSRQTQEKLPATMATGALDPRNKPAARSPESCNTDIKVQYSANPVLPDPFRNWVDMTYRVRGGRDGKGLIEIWANGRFIARVTGSIGDTQTGGPYQYFKFGIYREFAPGSATAYLDNFRRIRSVSQTGMLLGEWSRRL